MDGSRDGVDNEADGVPTHRTRSHWPVVRQHARSLLTLLTVLAALASASVAIAQTRRTAPKPSPTPNPLVDQVENVVGELRQIDATLGSLRAALGDLSERLDRVESTIIDTKGIVTPMREEVRGLYVETSNVRSEIARLEEKSVAEAESLGKSRYVLTLLLVATAVLQLVVLAVLLRSR